VLIAWRHQDIALKTRAGIAGISEEILTQTGTTQAFEVPVNWPASSTGARYGLVFVFDRPKGSGPISDFSIVPQQLLADDLSNLRFQFDPSGWAVDITKHTLCVRALLKAHKAS
jgi:hypothetical protein